MDGYLKHRSIYSPIYFSEDLEFKSQLDEESLLRAKEELNENVKDRMCAVQSFRNLILQEKWLKTPTGKKMRIQIFQQLPTKSYISDKNDTVIWLVPDLDQY